MKEIGLGQVRLSSEELAAANAVLESGALRQGPENAAFENAFSEKVGAEFSVSSSSGTAALHLAYECILEPGDEVLVPSFTFVATGSMVSMVGATPVFCDVARDTFLIDLDDAESRISPRTKAIAPVHLFGNPCDVQAIEEFAEKHGLYVVWDAAQAHGARYRDRDIGSFGDFVCYSFYPSKNMFVGEGGMTCVPRADFAKRMQDFRSHGQTGKYYHTSLGLNYRMTDVEAAIGRSQLGRLDEMVAARRENAERLNKAFASFDAIRPQVVTDDGTHAWHQYCVTVDPESGHDRDQLASHLKRDGIASAVHYPRGLHQQPIFIELYGEQELPVTEALAGTILALPVHQGLSPEDVDRVIESVDQFVKA